MRMIQRKCRCMTWERHEKSDCKIEYDIGGLFSSYDEWDEEFSDKWQIEYDPEEHFLIPEESDFERDPIELAVESGNLLLGKEHPLFLRAMTATLEDEEDEILCQLLFDGKKTLDIARSLGMTKLAVVRKVCQATHKIQAFCKNHPIWFAKIPVLVPDGPVTEVVLPLAA